MDPISELDAHVTMARLLRGRTRVTIAHRLRLVSDADQIIVVDAGTVVDQGNHEELLHRAGLYQQMFEAQTADVSRNENAT